MSRAETNLRHTVRDVLVFLVFVVTAMALASVTSAKIRSTTTRVSIEETQVLVASEAPGLCEDPTCQLNY